MDTQPITIPAPILHPKRITLELSTFLSILWGSRDIAHPDIDLANLISALDNDEQFCHVQFPDDENKLTVTQVWRIKTWKESEERRKLEKIKSDERVTLWNTKKLLIEEIAAGVESQLGMPEADAMEKARQILEKPSVNMAKMFGVDITEYLNRKMLLEGGGK